jgi:hypothetical protein
MNKLALKNQIAGMFHLYAVGKKPKFTMANMVVVKMGSG